MRHDDLVATVLAYLKAEFPKHNWMDERDNRGERLYFSAQGSHASAQGSHAQDTTPQFVAVTDTFLEVHRGDVARPLREWGLAERLRSVAGSRRVVVTDRGLDEEAKT